MTQNLIKLWRQTRRELRRADPDDAVQLRAALEAIEAQMTPQQREYVKQGVISS